MFLGSALQSISWKVTRIPGAFCHTSGNGIFHHRTGNRLKELPGELRVPAKNVARAAIGRNAIILQRISHIQNLCDPLIQHIKNIEHIKAELNTQSVCPSQA